jgi:hypothetical protein
MFRWLRGEKLRAAASQIRPLPIEDHLSDLSNRLLTFAAELEVVRSNAQAALPFAIEEADQARHVDRKARFVGYRDALHASMTQLAGSIERLSSMHKLSAALEHALRSGHLDPTTGQSEMAAIREVIQSLEREPSIDEVWLRGVRSIKKKFEGVLRERDRKSAEQKRKRLGFAAEWEAAKAEKDRMPKPLGQRDSLTPGK